MAYANKKYFAGHKLSVLYDKLFRQIKVALTYKNDGKSHPEIVEEAQEKALAFIRKIPEVQALLCKDVEAEYNGDPCCKQQRGDYYLLISGFICHFCISVCTCTVSAENTVYTANYDRIRTW